MINFIHTRCHKCATMKHKGSEMCSAMTIENVDSIMHQISKKLYIFYSLLQKLTYPKNNFELIMASDNNKLMVFTLGHELVFTNWWTLNLVFIKCSGEVLTKILVYYRGDLGSAIFFKSFQ